MTLDAISLRVLGSLMEKEMTTPDAYPMSLNALLAAANQRSSREPVMTLEEDAVRQALHTLENAGLVAAARDGGRVPRWEHRIRTMLQLRRDETALLCTLLLRGPQTPGELRGRSERLFPFDDMAGVQAALERLAAPAAGREEPAVRALPRAPGAREARWRHLLGAGEPLEGSESVGALAPAAAEPAPAAAGHAGAAADLAAQVAALERRVADLDERLRRLEAD